jgi:LysR family cys regulon transcriptional activator
MNLRQLRALAEVANQGLRISAAADALHTSQPGVSRQIRELEEELGVDIFIRKSNRLVGITEPGEALIQLAQRILRDADSMRSIATDYSSKDTGHLTIATTHTHACYTLPHFIQRFSAAYPRVGLKLKEGTPVQCCEAVSLAEADIAIATETAERFDSLVTLPAYKLSRCLVTPIGHPLLRGKTLTLARIAKYPIITYDNSFSSRRIIDRAFAKERLKLNIVLSAIDADVSKKYVALGLGVALLPTIAYDAAADKELRARSVDHLFERGQINVCVRKDSYLREYVYAFITLFAPHLTRRVVSRSLYAADGAVNLRKEIPLAAF